MTIILGVDIGITGAIAAIDVHGTCQVHDLPITRTGKHNRLEARALIHLVRELVRPGMEAIMVMEDVRARSMGNGNAHGNNIHSQGSLMRSRGIVEAVADIARLPCHYVQPQTWKREFGLLGKAKNDARYRAVELYPAAVDTLKRVKDHNRAEAILIAHYGRRFA